jgi:hypothetical protein
MNSVVEPNGRMLYPYSVYIVDEKIKGKEQYGSYRTKEEADKVAKDFNDKTDKEKMEIMFVLMND